MSSELEPVPGVDLLAAALRADQADLDTYSRVVLGTLADALPAGVVEVDRDRSVSDRMAGRPGRVRALRIGLGDVVLELVSARNGLQGMVTRQVRGVAISRKEVTLPAWTALLAEHLHRIATESASARQALARLLGAE
ncbi:MAG: hypothetical protein JWM85_617 [Acidimicrobiaceae bacterium]|nr:hypothetical protein [Acidimicrobiaceae bacterium]